MNEFEAFGCHLFGRHIHLRLAVDRAATASQAGPLLYITRHAYDFDITAVYVDYCSDWRPAGEQLPDKHLIDDGHAGGVCRVALIEQTTCPQGNSQSLEVPRRNVIHRGPFHVVPL